MTALHSDPRDVHRPRTPAERRVAIGELRSRGLKPRDIAQCLRVEISEVLDAIRGSDRAGERAA